MFMFDIETLGSSSESVVLSLACIHFDNSIKETFTSLLNKAFFVKFKREEQESLGRYVQKDVVDWWSTQSNRNKEMSLHPHENDVTVQVGINGLVDYMKEFTPDIKKVDYWQRGSLESGCIQSLTAQFFNDKNILPYYQWNDVRTIIRQCFHSPNGYIKLPYSLYENNRIEKHNPVHDCILDILMLQNGGEV